MVPMCHMVIDALPVTVLDRTRGVVYAADGSDMVEQLIKF